jgi:hypothetical protein
VERATFPHTLKDAIYYNVPRVARHPRGGEDPENVAQTRVPCGSLPSGGIEGRDVKRVRTDVYKYPLIG